MEQVKNILDKYEILYSFEDRAEETKAQFLKEGHAKHHIEAVCERINQVFHFNISYYNITYFCQVRYIITAKGKVSYTLEIDNCDPDCNDTPFKIRNLIGILDILENAFKKENNLLIQAKEYLITKKLESVDQKIIELRESKKELKKELFQLTWDESEKVASDKRTKRYFKAIKKRIAEREKEGVV